MEDAVQAATSFEKAGGMCKYIPHNSNEQGYFSTQSQEIKNAVKIPVILTGGITNPDSAERLLEDGKADFIGVGRAILKDSFLYKFVIAFLAGY